MFPDPASFELANWLFLRLLGLTYVFAYVSLALQEQQLLSSDGLTPVSTFLDRIRQRFDSTMEAVWNLPTVFWFCDDDWLLTVLAWTGVGLSVLVTIGLANVPILFALWIIYLSFDKVGQVWYGYGWESQLVETGFLALFTVPLIDPFTTIAPPLPVILAAWWLVFRVHVGAGLIKLRSDSCWRDLSCLDYHFETQPIPNPLSPYFHRLPSWTRRAGVIFTHVAQLGFPILLFLPDPLRSIGGVGLVILQLLLFVSGNLSFLNVVTVAPVMFAFDDTTLAPLLTDTAPVATVPSVGAWAYLALVAYLSVPVVKNLVSSTQMMNTSFNQFSLVNTYGAFGSVGRTRHELIVEGTTETSVTDETEWEAYEFVAKPGDVNESLPFIAPYQPRLAWQLWFAAMQTPRQNPWLLRLIWKLLNGDPLGERCVAYDPFDDAPSHVRVRKYRYSFAPASADRTWDRRLVGEWLPPQSRRSMRRVARLNGWE
jgi:hypothetical protein